MRPFHCVQRRLRLLGCFPFSDPYASNPQAIKKATVLPAGLLQAMVALHDALFLLTGVDGEALQAGIVKVKTRR